MPAGTRGPSREKVAQEREVHRWRRRTRRPSLRNGFTAYSVLSSVSQCLIATVASRKPLEPARNLTPASGRRDHTASPSANCAARLSAHSRPPHPALHVRDVRDRPSSIEAGRGDHSRNRISVKQKYFCRGGLTGICAPRPSGKSLLRKYSLAHRGVNPKIHGGRPTSALVRIPDSSRTSRDVRKVHIADINTKEPPPIREAAFASLKAPLRPVRAPVDPTDASEGREASGRRRTLQYDSRKTIARLARSS